MQKITIIQAAKVMGCSDQFVRVGLQQQRLDIGDAVKMTGRWTYNIVPAKLAARQGITEEQLWEIIRQQAS